MRGQRLSARLRTAGRLALALVTLLVAACGRGGAETGLRIVLVDGTPTPEAAAGVASQPSPTSATGITVAGPPAITVGGTFSIAVLQSLAGAVVPALTQIQAQQPGLHLSIASYPDAASVAASGAALAIEQRLPGQTAATGTAIAHQALALALPLTESPDDLTLAQLVAVLSGTVTNWQQVGSTARPVKLAFADPSTLTAIGGLVGQPGLQLAPARSADTATLLAEVDGGTDEAVVVPWPAPRLHSKAVRIDGKLPDDDGYPLTVDTMLLPLQDNATTLSTQLGATLAAALAPRPAGTVSIDAMGDLMLARRVAALVQKNGPEWPFAAVETRLRASDVRFANLELALTDRGVQAHKDYTFRAPPSAAQSLVYGGITVADLANNHILDYGPQGLLDTIAALNSVGVVPVGAGADPAAAHQPAIITVNGLRIAWLSYVNVPNDSITGFVARSLEAGPGKPGVAWGTPADVQRDVAAAKQQADLVIVALHAGLEYTSSPNQVQQDLAHAAIDAGAALVLGAHPHVLQGIEFYHGGVIAYSLGNFVFDLDQSDRATYGLPSVLTAVLRVELDAHGVTGIEVYPAIINSTDFRPEPVSGTDARPIYDRLWQLTAALNPR